MGAARRVPARRAEVKTSWRGEEVLRPERRTPVSGADGWSAPVPSVSQSGAEDERAGQQAVPRVADPEEPL